MAKNQKKKSVPTPTKYQTRCPELDNIGFCIWDVEYLGNVVGLNSRKLVTVETCKFCNTTRII